MHTNEPRKNPLTNLGYETEDLNMKGLWKGTVWFFGFTFFSIFAGAILFWLFYHPSKTMEEQTQQGFTRRMPEDPNPLLQTNVTTKTDMESLRKAERTALTTPAYVDQTKGIVRIPIDHAVELETIRLQHNQQNPPTSVEDGTRPGEPMTQPGGNRSPGPVTTPTGRPTNLPNTNAAPASPSPQPNNGGVPR